MNEGPLLAIFTQTKSKVRDQLEEAMYTIHIWARCPHQYAEMIPHNLEQAALVVESLVSVALLELFGEVIVENVAMACVPPEEEEANKNGQ